MRPFFDDFDVSRLNFCESLEVGFLVEGEELPLILFILLCADSFSVSGDFSAELIEGDLSPLLLPPMYDMAVGVYVCVYELCVYVVCYCNLLTKCFFVLFFV